MISFTAWHQHDHNFSLKIAKTITWLATDKGVGVFPKLVCLGLAKSEVYNFVKVWGLCCKMNLVNAKSDREVDEIGAEAGARAGAATRDEREKISYNIMTLCSNF